MLNRKFFYVFFAFVFIMFIAIIAVQGFLVFKYGLPALDAGVQILENVADQTKPTGDK